MIPMMTRLHAQIPHPKSGQSEPAQGIIASDPSGQDESTAQIAAQIAAQVEDSIEPTLTAYFTSFNQADFAAAAALFSETGRLLPPFDPPIVGPASIADYLEREAQGMRAFPQQVISQSFQSGNRQVEALGQVQTSLFAVNVKWEFILNAESEILSLRLKLLASLKELLRFKP